ncbi:MAG: hypothetical protein HRU18_03845 [Pseudoalteromonas sp.]|uniref:hypothetical protein n=1 Tax=Pseudoalteromonas sp. TaxID=53249 RepID=UPI001DE09769|nr:hypothetical protein [Pseudoalteromonas sp.]NRA77320.1 hypothetical protein [Pseudoalteromonas sp.]
MMKAIKQKELNKGLDGINLLRDLVNSYGWRDEWINENKTPIQLVREYISYLNGEVDLDGNTIVD